jgi:hypothetical protein
MPLLILVAERNNNLCSRLGYMSTASECRNLGQDEIAFDAPSFATKYLPRNPVHPKTVTMCPVFADRPGGPWEMIGLLGRASMSCIARCTVHVREISMNNPYERFRPQNQQYTHPLRGKSLRQLRAAGSNGQHR